MQYRYVEQMENKKKITISFAKLPYNIFKACLNLMCSQEVLNHSVTVIFASTQQFFITVDTENATINARSTKLCL